MIDKSKYNTIIWDWNGTLLNDAWLGVDVMNSLLSHRNLPVISIEHYREIFDFPVKDYYAKLGFDFNIEPFEIIGNEFIEKYNSKHFECKLRTSAIESLQKLCDIGIKQYVLSARNHKQLDEEFKFHGIHKYFEHFSGLPDNLANGKIELGKKLINSQEIEINKCVLIGDTVHDYEVAGALGIECILVEGGHQSAQRLRNVHHYVIKELKELCD